MAKYDPFKIREVNTILSSVMFTVMLLPLLVLPIFAQSEISCPSCVQISPDKVEFYKQLFPLIIWTDDTVYDHTSTILLQGFLKPENTVGPVTITVQNPIGNIVSVQQINPDAKGTFSLNLETSSPLWTKNGNYIIKAQSQSQNRIFKTNVEIVEIDVKDSSRCSTRDIPALTAAGEVYCIPYQISGNINSLDAKINKDSKSLVIKVSGSSVNSLELDLPRYVIDSNSLDQDAPFTVLFNNQPITYVEVQSDADSRKLAITEFPSGKGTIEIVGTKVVPEFGVLSLMILASAAIGLVVISKRNSFHLFTKI